MEGPTRIKGDLVVTREAIAFLQGVDPERGVVSDPRHELYNQGFKNKILVFPNSVGSSVGAYVIYRLKKNHVAPKAMINQSSDIITASGCAIAGIPLFDLPKGKISVLFGKKDCIIDVSKSELYFE